MERHETRREGLGSLKTEQMVNVTFKFIKKLSNITSHVHRSQGIIRGMKVISQRGPHIKRNMLDPESDLRSYIIKASGWLSACCRKIKLGSHRGKPKATQKAHMRKTSNLSISVALQTIRLQHYSLLNCGLKQTEVSWDGEDMHHNFSGWAL